MEANRPPEDKRSPGNNQPLRPNARSEATSPKDGPKDRPKETPTMDRPKDSGSKDRSNDSSFKDRSGEARSFGSLFSSLAHDVTALVQQEIRLAKAEGSEKMSQAVSGMVFIAIAAALALAGLIILLQAAVYILNIWLPADLTPWLSGLIVGGVVIVIGLLLVLKGRSNLQAHNLMPDKTIKSVKRDRDFVRKQAS